MSGREHLNEHLLLDAVYGIADAEAEAHLRACPECAGRLAQWREKRAAVAESAELSNEFLAAQRREIYRRIEGGESGSPRRRWLWAPALAAACALAVGVFVYHPVSSRVPVSSDAGDAQLFNDVYTITQGAPDSAAPMRGLFEGE